MMERDLPLVVSFDGSDRSTMNLESWTIDTLAYRVTLRGHTDPETGAIWTVDTMVNVQDEICGVNEPLWIAKRTLRFSPTEGSTTQLECWRPGSFPFIEEVE